MMSGLSTYLRARSLRQRLALLVAAALLPCLLLFGVGLGVLAQQQRRQAEQASLQLTRALSQAVDAELQRAVSVMETLAASPELQRDELVRFHATARQLATSQAAWLQVILLLDAQGRPLLNTNYAPGTLLPSVAEPQSLAALLADGRTRVGDLARGARGTLGVPVRVPVLRDGRLRYVLTAVIKPAAFAALMQQQRPPADWLVTVFDASQQRVARSRGPERLVGGRAGPEMRQLINSGLQGSGQARAAEGDASAEQLHLSFTRSASTGWAVAAGMPASSVYAGTGDLAWTVAGGLLLSLAVALLAGLALARGLLGPLAQLRQAAQQLGQGAVPPLPLQAPPELRDVFEALQAAALRQAEGNAERERLVAAAQAARLQAEDANRTKDEFLAMLGHELRNPLAPITTALRLMALRQPEALQNERRVLERQVAHMTRLVDDLLDVSRFARGKVQLKREPLDLRDVVQRAVEMVQPVLDRRSTPLRLELPQQPAWVAGDAVRLAQVASNLLTNAAKFTPPDGRIAVRLRLRDQEVELSVEDSGAGIAPELLPRVFELFVQGRQAPDRQVGGLGLGLAIVRTLVELHGGSVRAASEGEGRGSRFMVTLPRALHGQVSSTISAPMPLQAPNARRVLLVDDNHDALDMLAQLLRGAGHEVQVAGHAAQALALLEHWAPDVALLDLGLPGMDGFELARRLRAHARWRGLPLVALTGYGHDSDRERALAAGFDEHLVKPVDALALAAVIERLASAEEA